MTGELFGYLEFGAFVGMFNIGSFLGQLLAPIFANAVFDAAGSYIPSFIVAIAATVMTAAAVLMLYHNRLVVSGEDATELRDLCTKAVYKN